ncbi:hypothetical protein MTR_8g091285 [Medicago truncatula]|uniref:Uncharacterized protein n=1 Tax=Medicago truncatula TaxID=3880 RepID=A0A072TTZ1_MEDTR|nr:hypothetical protein MTR_8g091285 [Medicago truncatula]
MAGFEPPPPPFFISSTCQGLQHTSHSVSFILNRLLSSGMPDLNHQHAGSQLKQGEICRRERSLTTKRRQNHAGEGDASDREGGG